MWNIKKTHQPQPESSSDLGQTSLAVVRGQDHSPPVQEQAPAPSWVPTPEGTCWAGATLMFPKAAGCTVEVAECVSQAGLLALLLLAHEVGRVLLQKHGNPLETWLKCVMLSWLNGAASSADDELLFLPQPLSSSGMEARTISFLQLLSQVLVVENECRKIHPVQRQLAPC